MALEFCPSRFVLAATLTVIMLCGSLPDLAAAESHAMPDNRAPAGQMCPNGSFVIGFDAQANIVCSGVCGNGVRDAGEACDDGNTASGDGCSATCQPEIPGAAAVVEEPAAVVEEPAAVAEERQEEAFAASAAIPDTEGPVITDVEPSSVVFGTSEVTVTVTGSGFTESSVVIFDGSNYEPVVNAAGTRLSITIKTADLTIDRYAITISNGPGQETTRKKALAIY